MFEILPMNHNKNHYNAYNPFNAEDDFDRSLFGALSPFFGSSATELFSTDIRKDGDNFIMETDLPGFGKDDISIDIDGESQQNSTTVFLHSRFPQRSRSNRQPES